jgi:small redox-active disulfide protein 2
MTIKIEVLGTGCAKCKRLFDNVQSAVKDLGIATEVVKVEDINAIATSGVMMTPALIINGEIVTEGRVPDVNEIKSLVSE